MSALRSASVSNSLAARASSSSISGRTFWLIDSERHLDRRGGLVAQLVRDLFRLTDARPDERGLDLLDEPAAAELDDGVGLRLSRRADEVDDDRVARLRGPVGDRNQLGDRFAQRVELARDQLLGHLGLRPRHLEPRPVDDVGQRLHLDGRPERPRLVVGGRRALEVVLGPRHRPQPRARDSARVPAADVAVDGFGVETLLANPRQEDGPRHLSPSGNRGS